MREKNNFTMWLKSVIKFRCKDASSSTGNDE